jgi:hypothetical protein
VLVGAWGVRNARLARGEPPEPHPPRPYLAGFADDLRLGAATARAWLAPLVEPTAVQALVTVVALALAVVLVVAALQVVAELLVGRNYALALVAVTPLALLMVHLAVPTPTATLLTDRGVETLLGVVAGLVVGYLTRVRHPKPEPRGRGSV